MAYLIDVFANTKYNILVVQYAGIFFFYHNLSNALMEKPIDNKVSILLTLYMLSNIEVHMLYHCLSAHLQWDLKSHFSCEECSTSHISGFRTLKSMK